MEEKNIRLERDALAGALSVVERIVQAKNKALDPRYGALLLEADASTSNLSIMARDAGCVAIAKVGAEAFDDVRVAVPGRLLIDYVKALPTGGAVKLTTASGPSGETSTLEVDSGTHKCAIPALPSSEDYDYDVPAMDDGDTSRSTVPGGLFRVAVQAAASVARCATAGTTLSGINFLAGESVIRLAGCVETQAVLAYVDMSAERDGTEARTVATLPEAPLSAIVRHIDADEDVQVIMGKNRAAVICRAGEFYLQKIVGSYPNAEHLIPPDEGAVWATVPNEMFRQSLKSVAVLSRQMEGYNPVRLSVEGGAVVLDYRGSERGGVEGLASGTARIEAETDESAAGGGQAVVHGGYLTAHTAVVPSEADLRVGVRGAGLPVTARSSFGDAGAGARITYVVMAMAPSGEVD